MPASKIHKRNARTVRELLTKKSTSEVINPSKQKGILISRIPLIPGVGGSAS
jgi:hypothetical protein